MKRKIISTTIVIFGLLAILSAIFIWSGYFKKENAGIYVESDPQSEVFINGISKGTTPVDIVLAPNDYLVRVVPRNNDQNEFDDYETKISLVPGVKTIIKRNFNQNEDYSSGAIVSFKRLASKESYINVVSLPDGAQVSIDGKVVGYTPVKFKTIAGDHTLSVLGEGYLTKQIPTRAYRGYELTASVKLAKSGATNNNEVNEEDKLTLKPQIRINKTPSKQVSVKSGANIGFPEIAKVNENEVYDIIETGENGTWYKIILPDVEGQPSGRHGWVSSEFATKI